MKLTAEIKDLIQGGYDLHVHSAPDVLPRKMDDIDMVERLRGSGLAGYAIKSHYFCTSERAQLMNKLYPDCDFIGTITLNRSVGGINPTAMEMAARSGVKSCPLPKPPAISTIGASKPVSAAQVAPTLVPLESSM